MRPSGTDHDNDNSITSLSLQMISLVLSITSSLLWGLNLYGHSTNFQTSTWKTENNILFNRAFEGDKVWCLTNRFECFDRLISSINLRLHMLADTLHPWLD
jgi:hypothetical protein